jgi:DNA invertase Pin-like site-specific DNA recombinase
MAAHPKHPKPFTLHRYPKGDPQLIGYARVSTREQDLSLQLTKLRAVGCSQVITEKVSGVGTRPGWEALLELVRPRDIVVVWKVDRMGRKLGELVRSLDRIRDMGANVRTIEEGIDTSTKNGRFAFNIIAALAEKARDDIRENTRAGLDELRKRGRPLGPPVKLEPAKLAQITHLRGQGFSLREIGRAVNLGKTTVQRGLELAAHMRGEPRQMKLEIAK